MHPQKGSHREDKVANFSRRGTQVFYLKLWKLKTKAQERDMVKLPNFPFVMGNHALSRCGKFIVHHDASQPRHVAVHDLAAPYRHLADLPLDDDESVAAVGVFISRDSRRVYCVTRRARVHRIANTAAADDVTDDVTRSLTLRAAAVVSAAAISDDDAYLVTVTRDESNDAAAEMLHVVDAAAMRVVRVLVTSDCDVGGCVTCVCVARVAEERLKIFVGTDACQIHVIVAHGGDFRVESFAELSAHESPLSALAVSCNHQLLMSGSRGKTRRIWKLQEDGEWRVMHESRSESRMSSVVTCAAFVADDSHVIVGGEERSVKVLNVDTGEMVASKYLYAPLTNITISDHHVIMMTTDQGNLIFQALSAGVGLASGAAETKKQFGAIKPSGRVLTQSNGADENGRLVKSRTCHVM